MCCVCRVDRVVRLRRASCVHDRWSQARVHDRRQSTPRPCSICEIHSTQSWPLAWLRFQVVRRKLSWRRMRVMAMLTIVAALALKVPMLMIVGRRRRNSCLIRLYLRKGPTRCSAARTGLHPCGSGCSRVLVVVRVLTVMMVVAALLGRCRRGCGGILNFSKCSTPPCLSQGSRRFVVLRVLVMVVAVVTPMALVGRGRTVGCGGRLLHFTEGLPRESPAGTRLHDGSGSCRCTRFLLRVLVMAAFLGRCRCLSHFSKGPTRSSPPSTCLHLSQGSRRFVVLRVLVMVVAVVTPMALVGRGRTVGCGGRLLEFSEGLPRESPAGTRLQLRSRSYRRASSVRSNVAHHVIALVSSIAPRGALFNHVHVAEGAA